MCNAGVLRLILRYYLLNFYKFNTTFIKRLVFIRVVAV